MQFSVDPAYPGYQNYLKVRRDGKYIDVFLKGQRVNGVLAIDTETGIIVVPLRDIKGNPIVRNGEVVPQKLRGKITYKVINESERLLQP